MAKHAIIRLDNVEACKAWSVRFYNDTDAEAAIDNGNIVSVTTTLVDGREVRKAVAPTASDTRTTLGIVATPEVIKDSNTTTILSEFENKAGSNARAIVFEPNRIFSATAEAFSGTPATGKYVTFTAGSTLLTVADDATGAYGYIFDTDTDDEDTYFAVQVL